MGIITIILIIINLFLLADMLYIGKNIYAAKQQVEQLQKDIEAYDKQKQDSQSVNWMLLNTIDVAREELSAINAEIEYKQEKQDILQKELDRQLALTENAKKISSSAFEAYFDILEDKYARIEREYDEKLEKLKNEATDNYDAFVEELQSNYAERKAEYDILTDTVDALNKSIRRIEADEATKAIYQIYITNNDLSDVKALLDLCESFKNPRALRMVVWQSYFQKETNNLCTRLDANNTCGIYKITNIENKKCYVGQSVNIAERFKQHIKCGLGIDTPVTNSLYKAMMNDGVWNFTFEILEKCTAEQLNDCERKWIALFEADTIGYNGNKGVKAK